MDLTIGAGPRSRVSPADGALDPVKVRAGRAAAPPRRSAAPRHHPSPAIAGPPPPPANSTAAMPIAKSTASICA